MKIKWKTLLICLAIPLIGGGISAFISKDSIKTFSTLTKPPLSPPEWLFPIAWTVLYVLMGIASYLIITSNNEEKIINKSLKTYGVQLFFNFFWTFWFFNLNLYFFSFIWLVILWILILITIILFVYINQSTFYLMIPYLLWVSFAGYLNLGIAILN